LKNKTLELLSSEATLLNSLKSQNINQLYNLLLIHMLFYNLSSMQPSRLQFYTDCH